MIISDFGQLRIPDTTDITELGQISFESTGVMREIVLAGSGIGMMFADSRLKTNALTWVGALLIGMSVFSLSSRVS